MYVYANGKIQKKLSVGVCSKLVSNCTIHVYWCLFHFTLNDRFIGLEKLTENLSYRWFHRSTINASIGGHRYES